MSNVSRAKQHRTIVVGLVWKENNELLLCKMKPNRGVFPGQWGFPGGGIEPGEPMLEALIRELREELGIEVRDIKPAFFKDGLYEKLLPDGDKQAVYMIFLIFHCQAQNEFIELNEEFSEYCWVGESEVYDLDLNPETIDTLQKIGPWSNLRGEI